MSNYLKMEKKNMIFALNRLGWSFRKIERETGIRRETVSKYVKKQNSKPAISPTGSGVENLPKRQPGRPSIASPYHNQIEEGLKDRLSAQRIYQDLCSQYAYPGGYDTIKRYVRKLKKNTPDVYARIELPPGQEAQVDFGKAAPTLHPITGTYRRPFLFIMTLSFSRHSYEEVVWKQDVESFIRLHERAFQAFGGVPKVLRLDNLKAGVTRASLYDPEINKVYAAFARHAGFIPLPCKVRKPHHKGKVERGIGYTKNNALKGKRFESLEQQNLYLRRWNQTIARLRIHGSTKQQVWARFETKEKHALQPLPDTPFTLFHFGKRKVHPDGYIEVKKAYYSVPHHYLGRDVEVQWDEHMLRIYCDHKLIAVHRITARPGRFNTQKEHLPRHKTMSQESYQQLLLAKAHHIGEFAFAWAHEALEQKGPLAYRLLQGMLSFTRSYPKEQVDWACKIALAHRVFTYRVLKNLLKRQKQEYEADYFLQDHELIRPLFHYSQITHTQEV